MITLKAEKRDTKVSPQKIREAGKVPAVFYGKKEAATSIAILEPEFTKVWKKAGESMVINLVGEWGEVEALITDVQKHPLTGMLTHADFYVIEKGKKVKVKVPLEFSGVAPAVKELGGILVKVIHELEIEAMPKDLPGTIVVDVSSLAAFGTQILAKQIVLPTGVSLVVSPDDVVVSVSQPKDEPEEPEAPADLSKIEVEKKGKEAKEGEEAPAEEAPKAADKKK